MNLSKELANHFRQVHFGGNWTWVNVKDTLADIKWEQAITRINELNTIAALVFHINYFTEAVFKVLQGEALNAHDKYSFAVPVICTQQEWDELVSKTLKNAEDFANELENFPDEKLWQTFVEEKYGTYYRNFMGLIEHCHYHLGQIAIIKKF